MDRVISFRLKSIKTNQFATFSFDAIDRIEQNSVAVMNNMSFSIDVTTYRIECISDVEFIQNRLIFMKIGVSCFFDIEKKSWEEKILHAKDKPRTIPHGFLERLADLTYGVTRGVLHAKTENSSYNRFFLPIIDVSKMQLEDAELEIPED